ncbi:MAG: NAD-binding protein [Actinomycetota bacterium]
MLALAVCAAVLGAIGLSEAVGDDPAYQDARFVDVLYFTAQLFVLGSEPLDGPGPFPVTLEIARFLAPLATALAIVEAVYVVVRDRVDDWRSARRSGHAIVAGDTDLGWALAGRLATERPVTLIGSSPLRRRDLPSRMRVVPGDPEQTETLRAAGVAGASVLYACGDEGAANVGVGLAALELAGEGIKVLARSADPELVAALQARRLSKTDDHDRQLRIDFFSIEGLAARQLVDQHSPFAGEPGPVTVVGDGPFGTAVMTELADRRPADWPHPIRWLVADQAAAAVVSARGMVDAVVPSGDVDDLPRTGHLYVCLDDTDEALRVGLGRVRTCESSVVICLPARAAIGAALEPESVFENLGGRLDVFGILDAAADPDRIEEDLIEQLARGLHDRYRAEFGKPGQDSARPWSLLDERFQRSNLAQAAHIPIKLAAVRAVIVPALDGLPPFVFDEDEVERLAEMEHDRWMAERLAAGEVHGEKRDRGKTHPDILPWGELSKDTRNKDRAFVRALPALLEQKRLAILRVDGARTADC